MNDNYHSKRRIQKIVFWIVTILFLLLIILGITGYKFYTSSLEPFNPEETEAVEINIPMGSSRSDNAQILEKEEIIKSASTFNMYIRLNNEQGFQAGYYDFSPSMSPKEIIAQLQEGGRPIAREAIESIPIPEGITLSQIANVISKHTSFSKEEVLSRLDDTEFINNSWEKFPKLLESAVEAEETVHVLEGYLFPATYEYHEDMSLDTILTDMITKTDQVLKNYYEQLDSEERTPQEVLTMASYIEREGIDFEDRRQIASVFYNRIEEGMPLQTDVSVTYALGEHKERITLDDLEVDSPYNTYKYTGIGPGPVNNPSEGAIKAALDPADTDYYYFLADLKTKNVYFSKTYSQHLEYKARYLDGK